MSENIIKDITKAIYEYEREGDKRKYIDVYHEVEYYFEKYNISNIIDFGIQIFFVATLISYNENALEHYINAILDFEKNKKFEDTIFYINKKSAEFILERLKTFRDGNDYVDFKNNSFNEKQYNERLKYTDWLFNKCLFESRKQKSGNRLLKEIKFNEPIYLKVKCEIIKEEH